MARRSTRRGMVRRTARRAYVRTKRRTRRVRRRASYAVRSRARRSSTGLMRGASGRAIKECAWITAGGAAGLAVGKWMPTQYMGMSSSTMLGVAALGYGVYKNDAKGIYIGFGALYPTIQRNIASAMGIQ